MMMIECQCRRRLVVCLSLSLSLSSHHYRCTLQVPINYSVACMVSTRLLHPLALRAIDQHERPRAPALDEATAAASNV